MSYKTRFILALLAVTPTYLFADTLIFALDIIRHGDRTPIIGLPNVDYQWAQGLGQLTAEGMEQEYKLGIEFRKLYVDQTHLLPENYQAGTMYVRSTDYDRTLMSAQSLLMGLYPPGTGPRTSENASPALPHALQPIPIYTAPAKDDDIINTDISAEEKEKLLQDYVYSTAQWQQKDNALKDKYPLWSQIFGIPITNLITMQLLGDAVFIHQIHKAPLPSGLSPQDADTIVEAGRWVFAAQLTPAPIAKAYSSKLMVNIANYLNKGSKQKSTLKYVLLSAHDSTIFGALSFLQAPLDSPPPYASNLKFALYETIDKNYVVKITLNGKPVVVPACGGSNCDLKQFRNYVESNVI